VLSASIDSRVHQGLELFHAGGWSSFGRLWLEMVDPNGGVDKHCNWMPEGFNLKLENWWIQL